jgi:hypothetical protein
MPRQNNSSTFDAKGHAKDEAPAASRRPEPAAHEHKHANPVWQQLATRAQAKLNVTDPGAPAEHEADRAAAAALREPAPVQGPSCACGGTCSKCRPASQGTGRPPVVARSAVGGEKAAPPAAALTGSKGRPLDSATGDFFSGRFGQDFGDVRVHDDSRAAASAADLRAHAYTLGPDIVFGAGEYSPGTTRGRSLLAHELAHVAQQRGAPASAPATLARQPWGTAKTTAPPATNAETPGNIFRGKLKDEVALFSNAGVILEWIVAQRAAGGSMTSFKASVLFADAATMKKLKPVPATADELVPALEMLEFYEVVKRAGPDDWTVVLAPLAAGQTQADVNRAGFDQNRKDIAAFQKSFEKRFDAKGHPIKQIAMKELLEDRLSAGAAGEWKGQHDAEKNLAGVQAELEEFVAFRKTGKPVFRVTNDSPARVTVKDKTNVMLTVAGQRKPTAVEESNFDRIEPVKTGASPEVVARRTDIEKRLKKAEGGLYTAQGFHRFAVELVWFLRDLDQTSSIKFKAGTYPAHGRYGEYAADMYPSIKQDGRGFYEIDKAEQFVDDINKVAEQGDPIWGQFAWRIVYNDEELQKRINKKYGHRMTSAPHHGPAPDKLHMHLDVRPLNLMADEFTGFQVGAGGRIVLTKP